MMVTKLELEFGYYREAKTTFIRDFPQFVKIKILERS
jgi:hypothetical protein